MRIHRSVGRRITGVAKEAFDRTSEVVSGTETIAQAARMVAREVVRLKLAGTSFKRCAISAIASDGSYGFPDGLQCCGLGGNFRGAS
ncbi:MAG: hypothetical protein ABSG16_15570 [Candidatus Acidiferrum sp.]